MSLDKAPHFWMLMQSRCLVCRLVAHRYSALIKTTALRTSAGTELSSLKADGQRPIHLPSELFEEFRAILDPGLGIVKGFVHCMIMRSTVQPVASKLVRLSLSLRPRVSEELCCLEKMDVMERVEASEWVFPIVTVGRRMEVSVCAQIFDR